MDDEYDGRQWAETPDHYAMDTSEEEPLEVVVSKCLEKCSAPDFIMEPGVLSELTKYIQSGGLPDTIIDVLSGNYNATAQMVNLIAEWLIVAGIEPEEIKSTIENHLKEMIIKSFDPKKADNALASCKEIPRWMADLTPHPTWRSLIYRLAEEYPDCAMLNCTIKIISSSSYQAEITSISTAAQQQMEVFSSVLKTSISTFLHASQEDQGKYIDECARMVCHGRHTYVFSSVLLQSLSREHKAGVNVRRLQQEISNYAQLRKCRHVSVERKNRRFKKMGGQKREGRRKFQDKLLELLSNK